MLEMESGLKTAARKEFAANLFVLPTTNLLSKIKQKLIEDSILLNTAMVIYNNLYLLAYRYIFKTNLARNKI